LDEQNRKCFFAAAERSIINITPEYHEMDDKRSVLPTKGGWAETFKNLEVPVPKGQKHLINYWAWKVT
jgi:hypothetical protein